MWDGLNRNQAGINWNQELMNRNLVGKIPIRLARNRCKKYFDGTT
jgi:hypothetical protein